MLNIAFIIPLILTSASILYFIVVEARLFVLRASTRRRRKLVATGPRTAPTV